jgi:crotonobetainyl-CoA:carnitine CoA-transferase CaiB-like acyl-CoA transferase
MAGLIRARSTGHGLHIDVSGQEVVAAALGDVVAGVVPSSQPGRCFECQDGWVYAEFPPSEAEALCAPLDREGAVEALRARRVVASVIPNVTELLPVRDEELRHPWDEISHSLMGTLVSIGSPIRWPEILSGSPARSAPLLGEHTDEVLAELLPERPPSVAAARAAGVLE